MTLIERYLPVFQFVERHRLLVTAAPEDLLDAVTLADTIDDPWVRRFIRLRELPGRLFPAWGRGNALKNRAAFRASGVPKLVLNFSVESADAGHVWLHTETRIFCNDRKSFLRFPPYWWMIRPVSGLMRRRLLIRIRNAAVRRGFAVDKPKAVPSDAGKWP